MACTTTGDTDALAAVEAVVDELIGALQRADHGPAKSDATKAALAYNVLAEGSAASVQPQANPHRSSLRDLIAWAEHAGAKRNL
jgi:hypothetical protein